jgi:hypothetical protein
MGNSIVSFTGKEQAERTVDESTRSTVRVSPTDLELIKVWLGEKVTLIEATTEEPAAIRPTNQVYVLLRFVRAKAFFGVTYRGLLAFLHRMLGTGVPS